jgi:hypothetical protein
MNDNSTRVWSRPAGQAIACAAMIGLASGPAAGQEAPSGDPQPADGASGTVWFPGEFVTAPLLANPMEVHLGGGLLVTERDLDDSIEGSNLEAMTAIGIRFPVVRFQDEAPGRPAIDLGFEVGVWSRFFMESIEKEQIATDYRVGIPLGLRTGMWDFRLTLLHVSSHFGDDYIDDNPQPVFQSSREGFELLVGLRPGADVRLYAGGDLNLGRSEDFVGEGTPDDPFIIFTTVEQWAFRFGAEWDQTRWGDKKIAPFAAANFEITEFTDRIASHVKAGVAFRVNGVRLYVDLDFHDGPSPMGQFRTIDERWIGATLTVEL